MPLRRHGSQSIQQVMSLRAARSRREVRARVWDPRTRKCRGWGRRTRWQPMRNKRAGQHGGSIIGCTRQFARGITARVQLPRSVTASGITTRRSRRDDWLHQGCMRSNTTDWLHQGCMRSNTTDWLHQGCMRSDRTRHDTPRAQETTDDNRQQTEQLQCDEQHEQRREDRQDTTRQGDTRACDASRRR